MVVKFKRSVVENRGSLRVNIPKEIADSLNIKKGDTVLVYVDDTKMIVEKETK